MDDPRGRRSLKELLKTLVIFLLIGSAVYLTANAWIYDASILPDGMVRAIAGVYRVFGMEYEPYLVREISERSEIYYEEAVRPSSIVVTVPGGRCGMQYGDPELPRFYGTVATLLGEALGSAGTPERVGREELRRATRSEGVFIDYPGEVPLGAVAVWNGMVPTDALDALADRLFLYTDREAVWLLYRDCRDEGLYRCSTAVNAGMLQQRTASVTPNGYTFAYEHPELSHLRADIPVPPGRMECLELRGSVLEVGESGYESLMSAFGINPMTDYRYTQADGTRITIEGERSLRLTPDGVAQYLSTPAERGKAAQSQAAEADIIELTRRVAAQSAGLYAGDAETYLQRYVAREDGSVELYYGYWAGGIPIYDETLPCAAVFTVRDGEILSATVHLKHYAYTEETVRLLPFALAAALAPEGGEGEMGLCYSGTEELQPEWYLR